MNLKKISAEEEKKIQINILNTVSDFCNLYNIKYYLLYGTLLGAIRHKGFIPWDDDIDIGMFREDYERFFKYFNSLSQNNNVRYKAINIDTDRQYYLPMGKVIDTETLLYEDVNVDFPLGVFIDIFPIDYLPASRNECMRIIKKISLYEKALAYKQSFLSSQYSWWKNIYHIIMKMLLAPFSNSRICRCINNLPSKYIQDDSRNIGSVVLGIYGKKGIWKLKDFEQTVEMEFEGKTYPVPRGYDNVLHELYGEYMILPPIEKQTSHHKNCAYWR